MKTKSILIICCFIGNFIFINNVIAADTQNMTAKVLLSLNNVIGTTIDYCYQAGNENKMWIGMVEDIQLTLAKIMREKGFVNIIGMEASKEFVIMIGNVCSAAIIYGMNHDLSSKIDLRDKYTELTFNIINNK